MSTGTVLRRQAVRPALSRRQLGKGKLPPELLAAAHSGVLTKTNTAKGSQGRQAVGRVRYERTAAKARKEHPDRPVRAAFHATGRPPARAAVLYLRDAADQPIALYDAEMSRRDVHRSARYLGLVGRLAAGAISPGAFRARVRLWRPVMITGPEAVAGEYRFLDDSDAVLALVEGDRVSESDVWFQS